MDGRIEKLERKVQHLANAALELVFCLHEMKHLLKPETDARIMVETAISKAVADLKEENKI